LSTLQIPTPRAFLPLLKPARYKGAHGGRGSGKSHFFAELMIEENIQQRLDNVCLREVQKSLEFSVKKLLESKIAALNAGSYFDVQDKRIFTSHGGVIIFEGLQNHTADSIKSLEGFDRAWVEEAQSLSQRSLDLLRPTLRKDGSELWFGWNPDLETDPIDVLLRGEKPPPNAVVIEVNYENNPWFPEVLRVEMEYDKRRDPDKYLHVWKGAYRRNSSARVFKNWSIEEFDIEPGWVLRQGADWGFSVDPSVLVQSAIVGKKLYVPHEAYMVGCEIMDLPDLFDTVPESRKWWTTADSARPETISHMRKHWSQKIGPAVKGARSLEEGVEFLQSFDIVVHPRCTHTIDELTLYSFKTDPLTGLVLPVLQDKDNHVIDALRYACEGARHGMGRAPVPANPLPSVVPMARGFHNRRP
jgi:phage terminase large subunit